MNLIISFGGSSPMLKSCWIHSKKIIISFLTVSLNEMNYGTRHIKLFKIKNQPFAGVLQDRFFKNFAKFTEIQLCRSLFFIKVASELWKNVMSNLFNDTYGRLLLKMKDFLSLKIFKYWFLENYFSKLKIYKMVFS